MSPIVVISLGLVLLAGSSYGSGYVSNPRFQSLMMTNVPYDSIQPSSRQPVFNSFQEPRKIQLAPPAPTGDGIMDRILAAGARMDLNNSPKRRIPYPAAVSQALREPEPQNHPDLQQLQTANVPLESVKPAANGPVFDQSLLSGRPQISPIIPNLPEIKPLDFHN